jgi:hypothetical protein
MSANHIPDVLRGREPRPLGDWARDAKELGFEMFYDHDPGAFAVRVMLVPKTRKAKTAVDRHLQSSHPDNCIVATTVYDRQAAEMASRGLYAPPHEDLESNERHIAISMDDTAAYALQMAREAMRAAWHE